MCRRLFVPIVVCLLGRGAAVAEEPFSLVVDLANDPAKSQVPVARGAPLSVRVLNMAPSIRAKGLYEVVVSHESVPVPPLDLPSKSEAKKIANDPCTPAHAALDALLAATDEATAFKEAAALRKALKSCSALAGDASIALAAMTYDVGAPTVSLAAGELLRVTVRRPDGDDKQRTWEKVFTTGEAGHWLQSYGFTFLPNRDDEFFSMPADDGKTFTIRAKDDRRSFDFAPSIFFTWLPAGADASPFHPGVTGGLGYDLSAPTVFLGASVLYRTNLQVVAGVVMNRQRRLRGEYQAGDVLKESLDLDQLTEKTYRPNVFFGVALRLGKSPF